MTYSNPLFSTIALLGHFLLLGDAENTKFEIISYEEFEELTEQKSDKIKIYNFWATWCAPCVKEMPIFEKVVNEDEGLDLYFISLDDGRQPDRVTNFIEKRRVNAPVYLLDDVDFNSWIDKVSEKWSGAIPATLFVLPDGSRSFHEGEVDESELKALINHLK